MENILIGIIKFFGNTIEGFITALPARKGLLLGLCILIICFTIVFILTKDF